MASFTPGPWMYSGGYPAFVAAPDEDDPGNALKAMVCYLDARLDRYQRPDDEVNANGWLIEAAPDLYEACILAERALRLGIPQEAVTLINKKGDFDSIVIARIRLEEAIARVEVREDV